MSRIHERTMKSTWVCLKGGIQERRRDASLDLTILHGKMPHHLVFSVIKALM